jgi:prepilin-type N-terminal cleavage/methylation domain-containing protein
MMKTKRRRQSGFTLVEVMIAIGVMTVGSLGILSMHQAVSNANMTAHEMNTAIMITERWMERIERDALSWTEEGTNTTSLNATEYLSALAGQVSGTAWFTPTITTAGESAAFDYFGADQSLDDASVKYCVNLRMSWLRQGTAARVDVRTFWFRGGHMPGGASHPKWVAGSDFRDAECDAATADGWDLGEAPNVNAVFASTVVTWLRRE